jgi:hypothetical protein
MADEVIETTTILWGQRLSRALSGVVFGLAFFVLSFPLLWWNEGRSVARIKALDAAHGILVEAAPAQLDPRNNNKLVHMVGAATTADALDDGMFGVRENALKLKRIVEVYQWKETASGHTHSNFGGSETDSVTYSYSKVWAEGLFDSSRFKEPRGHENPKSMPYGSRELVARIRFGAFGLSKEFIAQIDNYESYPLTAQTYAAAIGQVKGSFMLNGDQYFRSDPANPQIGAMRVHYQIIRPGDLSIIGRQDKDRLSPFDLRIGLMALFNPLKVLADFVPLLGEVLGVGIALVTGLATLALSAITIAAAWASYRPVTGGALAAVAALAAYVIAHHLRAAGEQRTSLPAAGATEPARA